MSQNRLPRQAVPVGLDCLVGQVALQAAADSIVLVLQLSAQHC